MNNNSISIPAPPTVAQVLVRAGIAPEHAEPFQHMGMPFELKPHQYLSLNGLLRYDRAGLFDQPRTGKTICMDLASIYFAHYGFKSVFLMPPILTDQFKREFDKIVNHGLNVVCFTQGPVKRSKLLKDVKDKKVKVDVLAMSKEIFKAHLEELMIAGFNVLFFDECHMGLQNNTMWTKKKKRTTYSATQFFIENTPNGRLILSTGTPIMNELEGTYPVISLKSPEAYASRREFDYHHVTYKPIMIRTPMGMKTRHIVDGEKYRNVEMLNKNLMDKSTRALQLEVLDVKAPNVQTVPIHLTPSHMRLYRQVLKDKVIEVGGEMIDARQQAKLRALALQLITDPSIASDRPPKNAVIDAVQSIIDSVGIKKTKVAIFANYNRSVEHLHRAFKQYSPALVYGPQGSEKNRENAAKFTTDKSCRLIIANPVAGGVGLTLGEVSRTAIFVEPVSTPGQFEQASSRVMLSGQTEPVSVYILEIAKTISPKATASMLGKAEFSKDALLDSKTLLDELLCSA